LLNDVLILIRPRLVNERNVSSQRSYSVPKVLQVKDQVGKDGKLRVILPLLYHYIIFIVNFKPGIILEDLHEPDLVPVGNVIEELKEDLLLRIALVIVSVL
jgi:hypothetical protein